MSSDCSDCRARRRGISVDELLASEGELGPPWELADHIEALQDAHQARERAERELDELRRKLDWTERVLGAVRESRARAFGRFERAHRSAAGWKSAAKHYRARLEWTQADRLCLCGLGGEA